MSLVDDFFGIDTDIVEVATPLRVTVHRQEIAPAGFVSEIRRLVTPAGSQCLGQISAVFGMVELKLSRVEQHDRQYLLGQNFMSGIFVDVVVQPVFATCAHETD